MWILTHAFFAETFQPMNAAVTFQIGSNDSARAIRGKFTFAGAWESCRGIRTICNKKSTSHHYITVTGQYISQASKNLDPILNFRQSALADVT